MKQFMGLFLTGVFSLVVSVSLSVSSAHGSGFGVFTQGASALGQADAVVAHADGPSAIFFNPALMAKLPGTQVEVGTTLVAPNRDYTAPDGTTATTRDTIFTPSTFYLTHTFNDKFSAGLGVFNPFGLGTDWGNNWGGAYVGRYIATNSELTTWNINPAFSYRISPSFAVAAGVDIVLLDAKLESKGQPNPPSIPVEYNQKFTGDGNGLGYNFGVYWEMTEDISLGAAYRSQVNIDVDGDFTAGILPQSVGGKTTVKLPQQVYAGVAYRPMRSLVIETAMRWEDWSSFKQLEIQFAQNPFGLTSAIYPRDWHSTFAVSMGGKYRLNDTFSLMAGYLYGWNPVPDGTIEPAIPDSDTNLFTVGGEARFVGLKVALGYGYQIQSDRNKGVNQYGPAGIGTYSSSLHLIGLSIGYKF